MLRQKGVFIVMAVATSFVHDLHRDPVTHMRERDRTYGTHFHLREDDNAKARGFSW